MNVYGTCFDGGRKKMKQVKMDKYEVGKLPSGRYQVRGVSSKCSHELYRFVSEDDAKKLAKGKPIKKWVITEARKKESIAKKKRKAERKLKKKESEKAKKLKEKERTKKKKEATKKKASNKKQSTKKKRK